MNRKPAYKGICHCPIAGSLAPPDVICRPEERVDGKLKDLKQHRHYSCPTM
jgi:hypothetical protein